MRGTVRALALIAGVLGFDSALGSGTSLALDGLWSAFSDGVGGTIVLNLKTSAHRVTGSGTQTRGALPARDFAVSGSYRAPQASLTFNYASGEAARFEGTVIDLDHLNGRLAADPSGSTLRLDFVRP